MTGVGIAALAIAVATLVLGRRDVTRPAVAFGSVWFGCIALAQLRLTEVETQWSPGFTRLAFAGGLAFMLAATVAGGTAHARERIRVSRDHYMASRLVKAGLLLAAGGLAGVAYKAHVLGGIPLLSNRADELRGHAIQGGEVAVPAWSSALTDGFFLAMWCFLAAIWMLWKRTPRRNIIGLGLLAAGSLFGVALLASRNSILFAVSVPVAAAYLSHRAQRRSARLGLVAITLATVAAIIGGLFVVRLSEGGQRDTFLHREMDRQALLVRPVIPFYINAVYPLEAASRVYRAVPQQQPYTDGGSSLTSLPDAAFPEGKPAIGSTFAVLMRSQVPGSPTWSVATYQGRLYADGGWQIVLLGSLLLGLGFGALYRWARSRSGFLALAVVGYLAYYSAFMVYDNFLSFSIIAIYDLAVVALVDFYARGRVRATIASLIQPPGEAETTTG